MILLGNSALQPPIILRKPITMLPYASMNRTSNRSMPPMPPNLHARRNMPEMDDILDTISAVITIAMNLLSRIRDARSILAYIPSN